PAGGGPARRPVGRALLPRDRPGRPFPVVRAAARLVSETGPVPLRRSRRHKMIAGVCGGIAEWLGWDPTLVRVLYVVGSILSVAALSILIYVILWIIVPK